VLVSTAEATSYNTVLRVSRMQVHSQVGVIKFRICLVIHFGSFGNPRVTHSLKIFFTAPRCTLRNVLGSWTQGGGDWWGM